MQVRQRGMTIIEVIIATAMAIVMMVSVLTIASETIALARFGDDVAQLQTETNRSFNRLAEILRKCGWNSDGVTAFPDINLAGDELRFRIPEDLDGNGYPFDQASGDVEWSAEVFVARLDNASRTLAVYDRTNTMVWTLGSNISAVQFSTIIEDGTLDPNEVRVSITALRSTPKGDLTHLSTGSIFMRNSP